MKLIKNIILPIGVILGLSLFLFFTACNNNKGSNVNPLSTLDSQSDAPKTSTDRMECSVGGGECTSSDCMDKCDSSKGDIGGLFRGNDKGACQALTVNEVDQMHKAFSSQDGILKEPEVDKLASICPSAIKNLIKIDDKMKIWNDFLEEYSKDEAIQVVSWIAKDPEVFASIDPEDDDTLKEFLQALLAKLERIPPDALTEDLLDSDEYLLNVASDNSNYDLIKKMYDLVEGTAGYCSNAIAPLATLRGGLETGYETPLCVLKEVLCTQKGGDYIFEDSFSEVVDNVRDLKDYIRDEDGLLNKPDDYDQIEDVCGAVLSLSYDI